MFKPLTRPASCNTCAKAKRRCSKQGPTCLECWARNIICQWPDPKPANFVLLEEERGLAQQEATSLPVGEALSWSSLEPKPQGLMCPSRSGSWWFTGPETWHIEHTPEEVQSRPRSANDLRSCMTTIFSWLAEWVDGGCNPFIHKQLYRHRLPTCLQDAYMALSCYRARKPCNERIIRQLIGEKSRQLVSECGAELQAPAQGIECAGPNADPLVRLAQVQALLIYQLIGLYDGDAELRSHSERHMTVLVDWMCRAVDCASSCECLGVFLSAARPPHQEACITWETWTWYSWVLAESLRRTWLVMSVVQSIYMSTRDGAARCLGGMMCTSRKGFWEASSAKVWQARCCRTYAGLIRLTEAQKLLAMVPPVEVDDFARLMLEVTFGTQQTEGWGLASEAVSRGNDAVRSKIHMRPRAQDTAINVWR